MSQQCFVVNYERRNWVLLREGGSGSIHFNTESKLIIQYEIECCRMSDMTISVLFSIHVVLLTGRVANVYSCERKVQRGGRRQMNGCLSKLKWIVVCLQKASINDFAAHNNFSAIVYWQSPLLIWWTRESRDSDSRRGQNLSQISKNYRLSRNKLGALIGINRVTHSVCRHR